ncbi:MAG: nitroreductase family protein, partial [Caldiserica bacterium]|nr:nitroreductase family protein [Caldisericota bacterium]
TEEMVSAVLAAAILAPSGKNRQPWRFVVVADAEKRAQMIRVMREGIADTKARGMETGSAIMTARVMQHAPVTIFVFNPEGVHPWTSHSVGQSFLEMVDTQSIGAAIQNMLLAAQDLGLGTLWMCDVWSAYRQLSAWLGETGQLVAAVALGYPDEQPAARPRRPLSEVVRWL